MYVRSNNNMNAVYAKFDLYTFKGKAEEVALLDSGVTENFMDHRNVTRLGLGAKKLEQTRSLRNIDGTHNKAGTVTHYTDLLVSLGDKQERVRFYITDLGSDRVIFGYPWFTKFNPTVDWQNKEILGPRVRIETLVHGKMSQKEYIHYVRQVAIDQLEDGDELIMTIKRIAPEPLELKKTTFAQQMAEKAYDKGKVNTEETIPTVFKCHWRIFSEQQARQLPPR
jgi:hypothetical protein